MHGYEACDSIDGHLLTYATQEEAQKEAEAIIEDLNDSSEEPEPQYGPDSWRGVLLINADIADNQERIMLPNTECLEWNRSKECECMTIEDFITKFPCWDSESWVQLRKPIRIWVTDERLP